MKEEVLRSIHDQVSSNAVLLYMKGSPASPECGFSARTVKCLVDCASPFAYINILVEPEIREFLPQYANWPTFPQLYIDGELIGGSDIVTEMHDTGELKSLIEHAETRAAAKANNEPKQRYDWYGESDNDSEG